MGTGLQRFEPGLRGVAQDLRTSNKSAVAITLNKEKVGFPTYHAYCISIYLIRVGEGMLAAIALARLQICAFFDDFFIILIFNRCEIDFHAKVSRDLVK